MDDSMRTAIVARPMSPAAVRAADADRELVVEQLQQAHADGRIDLGEFDDRARQAWAARTYGELAVVTADLPTEQRRVARGVRSSARLGPEQGPGRNAVARWLAASLINLLIWAIVSVSAAQWVHPWWIWVAGPWGAVLLAGWISERVGGRRPQD